MTHFCALAHSRYPQTYPQQSLLSIDSVANRLGIDPDKAAVLAAELDELDLVRVGGGHSLWLTERGRRACQRAVKKSAGRGPSKKSGTGRAKAPVGRSR
jgi:hypothetical protein